MVKMFLRTSFKLFSNVLRKCSKNCCETSARFGNILDYQKAIISQHLSNINIIRVQ